MGMMINRNRKAQKKRAAEAAKGGAPEAVNPDAADDVPVLPSEEDVIPEAESTEELPKKKGKK